MDTQDLKLFVSLVLPFGDGSGKTRILGIYDNRIQAEARCYRASQEIELPTDIIECSLNEDLSETLNKPIVVDTDKLVGVRCKFCITNESETWWKCCPEHTSERGPDVVCDNCFHDRHPEEAKTRGL